MNTVEKLLKIDLGEIEVPKVVKTMYLKKLRTEFDFECVAIDAEKASDIQVKAMDIQKGEISEIDMFKLKAFTVIEGCKSVFKNKQLLEHFNCPVSIELVRKLLLDGELTELYTTINDLSSYSEVNEADEIKN